MKKEITMSEADLFVKLMDEGSTTISNLLLHHYHEIGMSTSELMVFLELQSYIERGNVNPSIAVIADHLGAETAQIYDLIQQLSTDHFLRQTLEKNDQGKEETRYDFTPLWHKLARLLEEGSQRKQHAQQQNQRQKLFTAIQADFGRVLNPTEMSIVNDWIDKDHYDPQVIELALRETVLSGNYNFRYMDRILASWEQKGLKTPQAVEADQKRFNERRRPAKSDDHSGKAATGNIPIFKLNSKDE